jgi:hypothetical protein
LDFSATYVFRTLRDGGFRPCGSPARLSGNILSEKAIEKVVSKFKKDHRKPITADDLQRIIDEKK